MRPAITGDFDVTLTLIFYYCELVLLNTGPGHESAVPGMDSELSHAYRLDSHITDATSKNADVIWVGCQNDPAARGGRSGDHDCIDGGSHACHPGEALEPRCRASDRIAEGNNLKSLQHLVNPGITFITKESLG